MDLLFMYNTVREALFLQNKCFFFLNIHNNFFDAPWLIFRFDPTDLCQTKITDLHHIVSS